jgi:hypothetical protein
MGIFRDPHMFSALDADDKPFICSDDKLQGSPV